MGQADFIVSQGKVGIGQSELLSALTVQGKSSFELTGTVSKTASSASVAGTATSFLTELGIGDRILIPDAGDGEARIVVAIVSNTSLTVAVEFETTASGQAAIAAPAIARFCDGAGNVKLLLSDQGFLFLGLPPAPGVFNAEGALAAGPATPDGNEVSDRVVCGESTRIIGGLSVQTALDDANWTIDEGDFAVFVDAGITGVTITLPSVTEGRTYCIYKVAGSGTVTIAPDGSDLINGVNSSKVIALQWTAVRLLGSESLAGWMAVTMPGA